MAHWQRDIFLYQIRDACIYWFVIPGGILGSGWLIDQRLHWPAFRLHPFFLGASLVLIVLGLLVIAAAMRDFSRFGQGTANPRRPPVVLVNKGIYAICRHPMFLGYDLAALGSTLLSHSPATVLVSFPCFLFGQILFLKKEERYLARRFKMEFEDYKKQVPFLIPALRSWRRL